MTKRYESRGQTPSEHRGSPSGDATQAFALGGGADRAHTNRRSAAVQAIRRHIAANELRDAFEKAQAFVSKNKRDPEGHFLIALIAERTGEIATSLKHAHRALKMVEHVDTLFMISRLERLMGHTDEALAMCDRALAEKPGNAALLIHRAGMLEEAGRFGEARAVVDPLIAQLESSGGPIPPGLQFELAKLLVQEKQYDQAAELIDACVKDASTPEQLKRLQYYLLAKAHDRAGRYAESFAAATAANDIGRLEFDPALYEQQVTMLIENWSAERIAQFPRATCSDELPVFIAGMPRSGTSLIDQIIDAHPKAAGVGELSSIEIFARNLSVAYDPDKEPPHCFGQYKAQSWTRVAKRYVSEIRKASPAGAERVVNKALGNNKLVGLLACLFPNTRVIHAQRDPRDVAISCYMGGFNDRLHPWTTRLAWVSSAWEQSERMMRHWKESLEIPILDVRYEDLVRDPETQFPRLIEFLGLPWDDACLGFHKSRRTVRTLSYDQVNRPLYTSSAGRNVNYAKQIEAVDFPAY